MQDPYLYENSKTLKNLLNIENDKELDLAESEITSANMMLIYEQGFNDFSLKGLCFLHEFLFGDVYSWAGQYRIINVQKREELLAGLSVWYSDADNIDIDLEKTFSKINCVKWESASRESFVKSLAEYFSELWQIHPFREGNTRTIVMFLAFFAEHYGYFFDRVLLAESAGYTRNAFVLASLDQNSEYEYLEKILMDAVCEEEIIYTDDDLQNSNNVTRDKYKKYEVEYTPVPHEYIKKQ